jgi:hypothetical protein
MEIVLGALVTVLIQGYKKLVGKIGKDATVIAVFVLCFLAAFIYNVGKGLISVETLKSLGVIVGTQFVIWGFVVKYIFGKEETNG